MRRHFIIAHSQNGTMEYSETRPLEIDEGNSVIFSSNRYTFYSDGKDLTSTQKKTSSDDKIVIGYTQEGLPFQIVVAIDSYQSILSEPSEKGHCDSVRSESYRFIDDFVITQMNDYAHRLAQSRNADSTTRDFIKDLYKIRANQFYGFQDVQLRLSVALCYEKEGVTHCAGFGIGDTGIVIKRQTGSIEQLVFNTAVINPDGERRDDAFDNWTARNNVPVAIDRNTIFHTVVERDDEIVGYTSLLETMEITTARSTSPKIRTSHPSETVQRKSLDTTTLTYRSTEGLASRLNSAIGVQHRALCEAAVQKRLTTSFGDDCTIGSVKVPSPRLQKKLAEKEINAIKGAAQNYINWARPIGDNGNRWARLFNPRIKKGEKHVYHGREGIERAQQILNLIRNDESTYRDIIELTRTAYKASGSRHHSLSRYLYDAIFEVGQDSCVDGEQTDREFAALKRRGI